MLATEHELQAPADYMNSAGAIGPEHRHFLISWMTMVGVQLQCSTWLALPLRCFHLEHLAGGQRRS